MIPVRSAGNYPEAAPAPAEAPLADWILPVTPLNSDATCADAYRIFAAHPELAALPVTEGQRPVGLVVRDGLLACLTDRFAPSHGETVPVAQIMERDPLTVEANCDFEGLMALVVTERPDALRNGFIVTRDGRYLGLGTGRLLLRAAAYRLEQRNREIETTRIEAAESTKSKGQFLAAVSHELRTPLNAIIGFSQIIAESSFGPAEFERYRSYARDIQTSGQHLLELINDILDMSKIEAGKLELHEETVEIESLIEMTLRLVRQRAAEGHVALASDVLNRPCDLRGDRRLLRQMLLNLVANAVKFTPPGGRVTVRAWIDSDGFASIAVADTGIGMATEDIPKAMMPFGQVDSRLARRYDGTGLGLPLAKAMAEAHGGTLSLESEIGRGTTVTVRLPMTLGRDDWGPICGPNFAASGI